MKWIEKEWSDLDDYTGSNGAPAVTFSQRFGPRAACRASYTVATSVPGDQPWEAEVIVDRAQQSVV